MEGVEIIFWTVVVGFGVTIVVVIDGYKRIAAELARLRNPLQAHGVLMRLERIEREIGALSDKSGSTGST